MTTSLRYGAAFAGSSFLFIIANLVHFLRPVTCWDCFFPYGVPLTLYQMGGEGGGAGIVWRGVAGDVACIIVVALLVGRVWQELATQSQQR